MSYAGSNLGVGKGEMKLKACHMPHTGVLLFSDLQTVEKLKHFQLHCLSAKRKLISLVHGLIKMVR